MTKVIRVNLSVDNQTHEKLRKYSFEVKLNKTTLAHALVMEALKDDEFIKRAAERYHRLRYFENELRKVGC